MRTAVFALIVILGTLGAATVPAAGIRAQDLNAAVADRVQAVMPKVMAWRRDIHSTPSSQTGKSGRPASSRLISRRSASTFRPASREPVSSAC